MNWLIKGQPYEVQSLALSQADGRRRFGYFLEMGLGKTAVCINEFANLCSENKVDLMVVVCPNSLKGVWKNEIKKWSGVNGVVIWEGELKQSDMYFIINYEAVFQRGGDYLSKIMKGKRIYMVLDESINVKNPRARRTKALFGFTDKAAYVRLLSGAPMVQSPMDLWSQLMMLGAEVNGNPFAFRGKYCVMGGWKGKQIVGARNEDKLQEVMRKVSIVAKKKDWTDLPDKLFTVRNYKMTGRMAELYKSMQDNFFITIRENKEVAANMVITQMMKLQQISSGFVYDEEGKEEWLIEPVSTPKFKLLKELIEETPNKIIIFCYYKSTVRMLRETIKDSVAITGGMSIDEIEEEKAAFNNGKSKHLIAQLTAAKYGHTLLGTEQDPCHTSIFFENFYSLDARIQGEDRNHRHGQKYPVTYIDFVGSSIEERIITALQRKQKLAESIVDYIRTIR